MLHLLLGRAGTGKTHRIYEELAHIADTRPRVLPILLVPEQFSFETERALLAQMGAQKAAYVRVLSFTRLAEIVAKEVGGIAGTRVSDASRTILLSQALDTVADHLTLYRRQVGNIAFIDTLHHLLSECKQCAVSPMQLEATGAQLGGRVLGQKTRELSLIFEAYNTLLSDSFVDPLDALSVLATAIPHAELVQQAPIFVDGFKGFTPQEYAVIRALLPRAASVTVALCTPTLQDTDGGYGLFSPVIHTANRLMRLAEEAGVPRAKPLYFTDNHRAQTPALRQLESEAFLPLPTPTDTYDGVTLTPCPDIYAECDAVAARLRGILRDRRYRARDLAIVMRNPADYRGILDAALRREGVPFFSDERESLLCDPLSVLILTAVRIAVEGFRTDQLLSLIKTGLCGLSAHSVALLENYAFLWNINGTRWESEWTMNPDGLTIRANEESDRMLWYLNLLRYRAISPLVRLRDTLKNACTGEEFAQAVYRYLKTVRADRLTVLHIRRLKADGEWDAADRQSQIWSIWMSLLDTVTATMGTTRLKGARLLELLQQAASTTDVGTIPATLDGVQVGAIDRIRLVSPRVVCILGANEGVFPAYPTSNGVFSDYERRELIRLGLPISDPSDKQAMEERFFAYTALSAPSHELHISWLCRNSAGESQSPSVLVSTVQHILPHIPFSPCLPSDGRTVQSAGEALSCIASKWQVPNLDTSTMYEALTHIPAHERSLVHITASDDMPAIFRNPDTARALFGKDMRLSPSQVDAFYNCRFAYFCRYGLRVQPPRPAEIGAAEFGSLAHTLMEKALPIYVDEGIRTITRARVDADTQRILTTYIDENMGGSSDKGVRFTESTKRLISTTSELLWHVVQELRQSQFVPTDYELPIGLPDEDGNAVPATVLHLPDGGSIQVRGIVDRVDVYHTDNTAYVRVVDYKTGSKKFRLSEVVEGLNLQMLIYLFTIWENGGPRYGNITPAGVLYLPATLPIIRAERNIEASALHTEQLRTMKMNGLLLDNPDIIRAMEADAGGVFIPAKLNKEGKADVRSSEVASLARLGRLKKRVETLLTSMVSTLHKGDVAAVPLAGTQDACVWCAYKAVCRREKNDPTRSIAAVSSESVWKWLEESDLDNNL